MLYGQLKEGGTYYGGNVMGWYRGIDTFEEYVKQVPPRSQEELLEVIEVFKEIIAENFKNYGLAEKSLEECQEISKKYKKILIERFNAPETLKLPGLGIE